MAFYATQERQNRIRSGFKAAQRFEGFEGSLGDYIVEVMDAHTRTLEKRHNDGKPFPEVSPGSLRPGARVR